MTSIRQAAYEAYVRGWHFLERNNEAGFHRAILYFAQAIDADPTYAPAYVGLSLSYQELGYFTIEPARTALPKARAAALKALELDSTSGEARPVWQRSTRSTPGTSLRPSASYQRALALSPRYARGHMEYRDVPDCHRSDK